MDIVSSNSPQDNPHPKPKHPGGRPRKAVLCTLCGESDPGKFYYNARGYRNSTCKLCDKKRAKVSKKKNKDQYNARQRRWRKQTSFKDPRKRHYGVSSQEYQIMLETQNGLCAICNQPPALGRVLHVDHCHKTGRIRGLLCQKCNHGIGLLQDSPAILRNAAKYLE